MSWVERSPRQLLLAIGGVCVAMLGFGAYLQHVVGLEPCPMCVVQRYCLLLVAVMAFIGAAGRGAGLHRVGFYGVLLFAVLGAFVAARQSWLQWYPPEVFTCGRDIYGMIETFPLKRALPMIFRGSGDCTKVDWTFLGGSIANWSFICFVSLAVVSVVGMVRYQKRS